MSECWCVPQVASPARTAAPAPVRTPAATCAVWPPHSRASLVVALVQRSSPGSGSRRAELMSGRFANATAISSDMLSGDKPASQGRGRARTSSSDLAEFVGSIGGQVAADLGKVRRVECRGKGGCVTHGCACPGGVSRLLPSWAASLARAQRACNRQRGVACTRQLQ